MISEKFLISRIKRANQQSPLDFESFFFSNPPQIFQTHTRAFSARRERWRSRSIRWLETRGKARRTNWPTDRFGRGAWLPVTRASARWPDAHDRGGGTTVTGPAGYRRSWMDAAPIVPRDNTPSVAVLMTMIAADRVERSPRDGDRHAACVRPLRSSRGINITALVPRVSRARELESRGLRSFLAREKKDVTRVGYERFKILEDFSRLNVSCGWFEELLKRGG